MDSERHLLDFGIPVPIEGREGIALQVRLLVQGAALQAAHLSSTWEGIHTAITCNPEAFTVSSQKNVGATSQWVITIDAGGKTSTKVVSLSNPNYDGGKVPTTITNTPPTQALLHWATTIARHAADRRGLPDALTQYPIWKPGQLEDGMAVRFQPIRIVKKAKGDRQPQEGMWTSAGILHKGQIAITCKTPLDFIKHRVVALRRCK